MDWGSRIVPQKWLGVRYIPQEVTVHDDDEEEDLYHWILLVYSIS